MLLRYYFQTHKNNSFYFIFAIILLTACIPNSAAPPSLKACKDSTDPNIYSPSDTDILVDAIYKSALVDPNTPVFNPVTLPGIKTMAFRRLTDAVIKWSNYVDMPIDPQNVSNTRVVRITLTFLDPELIELVFLNHYLSDAPTTAKIFHDRVNEQKIRLGDRKELIFFATFTSSYYNQTITDPNKTTVKVNIDEIKLLDANGVLHNPRHYDAPLGQDCCISRGPISGYIAYPMYVIRNEVCVATLDRNLYTTMTIRIGKVIINNNDGVSKIWALKYHPLLDVETAPQINPNQLLYGSSAVDASTKIQHLILSLEKPKQI